jgi:chemotaxis methyl-accepting protein methylase
METGLMQRFIQLITAHTGLQFREAETDKLRHTVRSRMAEHQLFNPEAYYQLLPATPLRAGVSGRNWSYR